MSTDSECLRTDPAGVYVHVPFCERKCRYCGFYSEPVAAHDAGRVVSALICELDVYSHVAPVRTLYVGGGSPTCLPADLLKCLLDALRTHWPTAAEFTVECNPGQTDAEMLAMLRRAGVNRLSFGVQSFDDGQLALLGRRHSADDAVRALRLAREHGFDNVGLDLIFAVPGMTLETWRQNLELAAALGVQHISAYSLSIEEGTDLYRAAGAGEIAPVDENTDRAMYDLAIDFLASAGFVQYEISNFARPGFACQHNLSYWRNRSYVGIGPAAGSYLDGRRAMNVSSITEYVRRIEAGDSAVEQAEAIDKKERICETAVLNLRAREGVDLTAFQVTTGVDFAQVFARPLECYRRQGLIEIEAGRVRLAREALPIADAVLCDFASF